MYQKFGFLTGYVSQENKKLMMSQNKKMISKKNNKIMMSLNKKMMISQWWFWQMLC